jgi:glycosyltransferase involved in cell wall biosynthesis
MLILINGLPLFGRKLASDLNEFDSNNRYLFLNTYYSTFDKILFIFLVPFCRLVISFNGVSDSSGALNAALFFRKKIIMQWQGTDVLLAKERHESNRLNRKYIDRSFHFTDFQILADELKTFVSNVAILPYKYIEKKELNKKYDKIQVLSYIAKNREEFYGINQLLEIANKHSEIDFLVVGTDDKHYETSSNIKVLGWVSENEMSNLMFSSAIYFRFTKHDGNSLTVSQALSYGCEVLWTYPSNFVYHMNYDNYLDLFDEVLNKIKERNNVPNITQHEYLVSNYSKKVILSNYVNHLVEILHA